MKTDELIKALSADAGRGRQPPAAVWAGATALAALLGAAVFLVLAGPRPDIAAAAETPRFLFKFVVTLALALTAWRLALRLSRPGDGLAAPLALLAVAPALLLAAVAFELLTVPPELWRQAWIGSNILVCLTLIPLIGLAPLALFLAAMRHGAPTRPGLAGAAAGLLAGGVAASFYAAHCTDDSPLFVATWYPLAIALLTIAGFLSGRHLLRW